MNSLAARLFAAFLAIILVVVALVGFTLLVLLRNNPLVERQALIGLHTVALEATRTGQIAPGDSPDAAAAALRAIAAEYDVRALVATPAGQVRLDSAEAGAPELNFRPFRTARADPVLPNSLVGTVRDNRGRLWLFVARPLGRDHLLVVAEPRPRLAVVVFFVENLLVPLLKAAGVATLVAVLLAVLISRSIARPLHTMAAVAQSVARGRYDQPAPVAGPDEVRLLGQSINSMARQVQAAQQAERDFLANVSHELKTPLTSIQGFAQAMLDGAVDSAEGVRRSANIIFGEADRMRRLVESLLDLARLEAGLRALTLQPLDLRALLTVAADGVSLRARETGVALNVQLPPALPPITGDGDRLAQVLTNLLDNALKHTPAGGAVTLSAAVAPGAVEVAVADTGSGIPPEDLSRIFERFYQVDKSRPRSGGLGLGLAISRDIVEAHGGTLRAESQVGAGSRFTVRLPTVQPGDTTVARKR